MRHHFLPVILAAAVMTGAATASDLDTALAVVSQAISKGYGAECDLGMRPSADQAYYPCIDVGPYRFVAEYGKTRGFVLVPDQEPFEILVSDGAGARFTVQGNWMTDLPVRVQGWWSSVGVTSGEPDRAAAAGDAVAAYLRSLEPPAPEVPPAPAATQSVVQQPQVFYIVPPAYGQPASPAAQPAPTIPSGLAPQGGVLMAPGVVGYPAGVPQ